MELNNSTPRKRAPRKGQFSCTFCRTRKLRCDRPLPCTSCRSRGKTCEFDPAATAPGIQHTSQSERTKQRDRQKPLPVHHSPTSTATSQSVPSLPTHVPDEANLLAEIHALKELTRDLEERITQSSARQLPADNSVGHYVSPAASTGNNGLEPPHSTLIPVNDIVSRLQVVSMSRVQDFIGVDDVIFKIEHIRAIPQAPTFIAQLGKPTTCVWLPTHTESQVLVDHYVKSISCVQHIIHQPSLPALVDDVYRQIEGKQTLRPGSITMLLSIIASATHVWVSCDKDDSLFLSPAQAQSQTLMWIHATQTVLSAAQNNAEVELEMIQGIAILGCVVCNIEGVSLRYRHLLSTASVLGRELELHRIDRQSDLGRRTTLQCEMGRRVWWYLVATDWLMAARFGGPGEGVYQAHPSHMTVNKPCNVNDVDIVGDDPVIGQPLHQATDMSYFLQRIHLAEISRSIVDHNLIEIPSSATRPSYYAHIMAMDYELDQLIQNVPSFFQLDNYPSNPQCEKDGRFFLQAYMLNSMVHLQRCKLHLAYLTSGSSDNPAYAASRNACLKSARQIIRGESQLLQSQHSFVQIRLRFAAILYGIFMAGIVLLMDACLHRPASLDSEISEGDLADALRMIRDVKSHSFAAANLHESLMQIVARYRGRQAEQVSDDMTPASPKRSATGPPTTPLSGFGLPASNCFSWDDGTDILSDHYAIGAQQQAQNLDDTMFMDQVQWDDLFTGLASATFF